MFQSLTNTFIIGIAAISQLAYLPASSAAPDNPLALKHSIIIYSAEDNDLQETTFADFAKLTENELQNDICVHQLMDTTRLGSFTVRICGNPYEKMDMVRLPNQDMGSKKVLEDFIKKSIQDAPAQNYSLILQGHGFTHTFKTETTSHLFVSDVREILQRLGVKLYMLSLDMCLMSTLETLYELRDVAEYVVANEDYCPWNGIISPSFLGTFEKESDGRKRILEIADSSASQNRDLTDPADLTVVDAQNIEKLGRIVKSLHLCPHDFQDQFLIDPNEKNYEYDLYELVMSLSRLSTEQKNEFKTAFDQALVFYRMNKSRILTGKIFHGISILKSRDYPGFNDRQREAFDGLQFQQDVHVENLPKK